MCKNPERKENLEKRIIDMIKEEHKLFSRYINSKLKEKEGIGKLEVEGSMKLQQCKLK